jgi:pyrimidine operon attenuation protein / uracil phosphoribosyltransferase
MTTERSLILHVQQVNQTLLRMAQEIYEQHFDCKEIILVGIKGNGEKVAQAIFENLKKIAPLQCAISTIHLDKKNPTSPPSWEPIITLKKKNVVLIDDVIHSGKTLIHASHFICQQDPTRLSMVTLVNREHRMFPVGPNVVGITLSTNLKEHVAVEYNEDGFQVFLENRKK